MITKDENSSRSIRIVSILAISFCCIFLFPQARYYIVGTLNIIFEWNFISSKWTRLMIIIPLVLIVYYIIIFLYTFKNIQYFFDEYKKNMGNLFIYTSIAVVVMGIIVRIVIYIKCRSFYIDEVWLAENIVTRNWSELLTPPLANIQSAPVLYIISVKLIGLILGYSESSLRLFSLFSFIGLLICEIMFLKKVFNYNNLHIAFIVVMTSLFPGYIRYSNEFKPYMGDAFFIVLTILLYCYYMKNKIKLPLLTILYIMILGYSSPAIFFIGGSLFTEFLINAIYKNKKQAISVFISGAVVLATFGLYYYWWMLPVSGWMRIYWDNYWKQDKFTLILNFFSEGDYNSLIILIFVPLMLLGLFSMCRSKNKVAYSVVLSLLFAFLASAMGYWPLNSRLWLFLPAIVFIFTPNGFDFIHDKIKYINIVKIMGFSLLIAITIYLSNNLLEYPNKRMYLHAYEINPLIDYVQGNIKSDEKLYVFSGAEIAFKFKNGYTATKIGNGDNDNIIFGKSSRNEWYNGFLGNDLILILDNEKVYLIFYDNNGNINNGLDILRNYGTLTEVMNVYNTLLYYFKKGSK